MRLRCICMIDSWGFTRLYLDWYWANRIYWSRAFTSYISIDIYLLIIYLSIFLSSDAKTLAGEFVAETGSNKPLHAKSILSQVTRHKDTKNIVFISLYTFNVHYSVQCTVSSIFSTVQLKQIVHAHCTGDTFLPRIFSE